ncbi:MAG: OsmC family protein [Bacteroidales bacterium]|jgi:putative redox protein|nr:OsmC family protein [Bacteroidales bacterium]MDD2322200.1 OsmC family protein [Bacteroidales bacterium]MDD3010631.1 OsmC family protein [Bacteroidales bacterium]MDD3960908.1 OsmC family protein [Bacteroidales bacterium]MDY0285270.1 OsmC family protein [Bacteroidales bacterium]
MNIDVLWKGNMVFESVESENHVVMDAYPKVGGDGKGMTPKQLLLVSLAGCTAMDVISILAKMKVNPEYFNVRVDAQTNDTHPIYFTHIKLIYQFKGKELNPEKLEKAVNLSQERYCGISYMLGKAAELTYEIEILS